MGEESCCWLGREAESCDREGKEAGLYVSENSSGKEEKSD
jgi:hypothetical protein